MEEPLVKMPPVPVSRKHMEGNVEFKDVSYTADDEDIVKDISFSVKKDRQSAFSVPPVPANPPS